MTFNATCFCDCSSAVFESMLQTNLLHHYNVDLPKLNTIHYIDSYNYCFIMAGKDDDYYRKKINGNKSYNNKLVMRSMLPEFFMAKNLDLPKLTSIQCKGKCRSIHCNMGYVVLESRISYLITK